MEVTTFTKKYRLSQSQAIRLQLLIHFTLFRSKTISERDLDILTLLSFESAYEQSSFCQAAAQILEVSPQTIRNRVGELIKRELIIRHKDEHGNTLVLNFSDLNPIEQQPTRLDFQFLVLESPQA